MSGTAPRRTARLKGQASDPKTQKDAWSLEDNRAGSSMPTRLRPRLGSPVRTGRKGKNKPVAPVSTMASTTPETLRRLVLNGHESSIAHSSELHSRSPSPLTPLSSYSESDKSEVITHRKARPRQIASGILLSTPTLDKDLFLSPTKRKRRSSDPDPALPSALRDLATTSSAAAGTSSSSSMQWDRAEVGTCVWTRVLVDTLASAEGQEDADACWWPGQVDSWMSDGGLRIRLFVNNRKPSAVTVLCPSDNLVLPSEVRGKLRFNAENFLEVSSPFDLAASPRKRVKHDFMDLKTEWRSARIQMLSAKTLLDAHVAVTSDSDSNRDELPYDGVEAASTTPSTQIDGPSLDTLDLTEKVQDFRDEYRDAQGFARTARSKLYWPAKVIGFKDRIGKFPLLEILYCNNEVHFYECDMFISDSDERFATCRLGKFESRKPLIENDDAKADVDPENAPTCDREPSPKPEIPFPSDFALLTIREQMSYTKPIIRLVMRGKYKPAHERATAFFIGGAARRALMTGEKFSGSFLAGEIESITSQLIRWVHEFINASGVERDAVVQEAETILPIYSTVPIMEDSVEMVHQVLTSSSPMEFPSSSLPTVPPSSPTLAVEGDRPIHLLLAALNASELRTYCTDVLMPETVIQLELWRNGARDQITPYDMAKEAELREKGLVWADSMDWVHFVMCARERAEKQLAKLASRFKPRSPKKIQVENKVASVGGSRSRPRKLS